MHLNCNNKNETGKNIQRVNTMKERFINVANCSESSCYVWCSKMFFYFCERNETILFDKKNQLQ